MSDKDETAPPKRFWLVDANHIQTPIETFDDLEQAMLYAGRENGIFEIWENGERKVWPTS